jgi:hypothetical protein
MSNVKYKRRRKIIKPRLQLKLVGVFVGLSALAVLLQTVLVAHRLSELSAAVPIGGEYLLDAMPGILTEILIFTFGLVMPLIFAVGVLVTHRIAGPVYRFEQYLGQVVRGEDVGPCRIRKGDELQDLCIVINEAAELIRDARSHETSDDELADAPAMRRAG